MRRIYIAGPISKPGTPDGLLHNLRQADEATLELMRAWFAVHNPMLTCYLGGVYQAGAVVRADASPAGWGPFQEFTHAQWVAACLPWVEVSDAVLRLPGESKGADIETAHATEKGIPVFHSVESVIGWFCPKLYPTHDLGGEG